MPRVLVARGRQRETPWQRWENHYEPRRQGQPLSVVASMPQRSTTSTRTTSASGPSTASEPGGWWQIAIRMTRGRSRIAIFGDDAAKHDAPRHPDPGAASPPFLPACQRGRHVARSSLAMSVIAGFPTRCLHRHERQRSKQGCDAVLAGDVARRVSHRGDRAVSLMVYGFRGRVGQMSIRPYGTDEDRSWGGGGRRS